MRTHIAVRLDEGVLREVDEMAKRDGRNRTQEIEWLLRRAMKIKDAGEDVGDIPLEDIDRAGEILAGLVPAGNRRLCKRHPGLGMYEDDCTGPSCRIERADRERRKA